jgi:selenocysteine lyase/cysteine desulfurase
VAALINARPDDVALTTGASHGFSQIAALLGPPAHVVAMQDEFPRVTVPFRRHGDRIALVASDPGGAIPVERIAAAIEPDTRAVVTSAVMHATGFRQDLAALARRSRERREPLVVDASQAVGFVSIDVQRDGIDALAFAGYKGAMGGHGSGALYLRPELLATETGSRWARARELLGGPDARPEAGTPLSASRLELGSPPFAGVFALGAGIELLQEIGMPRVEARIHELTGYLHAALDALGVPVASPRPRAQRAAITIVRLPDALDAVATLANAGIIVSARGEGIRIGVHIYNIEAELDRAADAIAAILEGRMSGARGAPCGN